MATRVLPGAYVSLNDLSQFPEGETSLIVGYVLKSKRGKVNEAVLCTNPTDFLTKYTLTGAPAVDDDPTFWSILKVLARTNQMYIVRAANKPLYGGAVVRKSTTVGVLTEATKSTSTIKLTGTVAPAVGAKVIVKKTGVIDGIYTINTASVSEGVITVTVREALADDYTPAAVQAYMYTSPIVPLTQIAIGAVVTAVEGTKTFTFTGDLAAKFTVGSQFVIAGADEEANNKVFTVKSRSVDTGVTSVVVEETVAASGAEGNHGTAYFSGLVSPEGYSFGTDDLMLITGVDQGAYNGELSFDILSSKDNADDLVYANTMQLTVRLAATNEILETFTFSRDVNAKEIDGTSLYLPNVLEGSAYINVRNNEEIAATELPISTIAGQPVQAGGGSDGEEVDANVLAGALNIFADKTIPVSIIGNGCSNEAETNIFQQAMLELADTRKDLVVFLNSRKTDEKATLNSVKAQNIVDYKKGTLASTSFYGCMYAPHVNTPDSFNSRSVSIGTDAVAIAGWLSVISNLKYPYAYAGPQNGLVSGVTCDWKIGDESGEAQLLNDASINYVAFDGKVGRYYMQCQNTLQIANSSLRNLGCLFNVLDIKEHMGTALKEYGQLPITDVLRRDILNAMNDYLSPMVGTRFYNYAFQDVTTPADIAQDTLRYLLTISLTRYASKIYCTINVVNATFDFSVLASV